MNYEQAPTRKSVTLRTHRDLEVFQLAMEAAMLVFEISKSFPKEETYSLTDQVRRSSRSVCANIAEAWRKRRYQAAFISKLSGAESEAAETQVWIEFAVKCGYLPKEKGRAIYQDYESIIGAIIVMISRPKNWILKH